MEKNENTDHSDDSVPEFVLSTLKDRYGPTPDVPTAIDQAILADAQRYLAERVQPVRRRRQWSVLRWATIGSTVAAACLMVVTFWPRHVANDGLSSVAVNENDIDENGRVDILDAFVMARQIQTGDSRARDLNHDGQRDQLDVDLVARNAVML
jgi:Dockerin type I domain